MQWVKQPTDGYRRPPVLALDDAAEVALERGRQYAGDQNTHGVIPAAALPMLMRSWTPAKAKRITTALVAADLWEVVPDGWRMVGWDEDQKELERLLGRLTSERDRQAKHRTRKRLQVEAPEPVLALRDALAELGISPTWGNLEREEIEEIAALISEHGAKRMITAVQGVWQRNNPARSVRAFLPTWRDMRPPRRRAPAPDAHPFEDSPVPGVCERCGLPEANARHQEA